MSKMNRILVKLGLRRSTMSIALPYLAAGGAVLAVGAAGVWLYPRVREMVGARRARSTANGHGEEEYAGNYPT